METSALRLYVSWVLVLSAVVALAGLVFLIQRGKMSRLNRDLRRLASEDALTGLPNRRTAYRQAELLTNLAARSGRALSIAVLDIDHFKSVNDNFGHPAGDGVLRTVAGKLKAELRGCDVAARMGGEEFILILPDSDEAAAHAACERIRLAIAETVTQSESHAIRVTVSVGIATSRGQACGFETLYQRADKALYDAKAEGRDRVVAFARPLLATG